MNVEIPAPTIEQHQALAARVEALETSVSVLIGLIAPPQTQPPDPPPTSEPPIESDPVAEPAPDPVPVPPVTEPSPSPVIVTEGRHAYFDRLRSQAWRAYSLRDPQQLARLKEGGYASASGPLTITYDADMDAAKVAIPAFMPAGPSVGTLAMGVEATPDTLVIANGSSLYVPRRAVQVDDEILLIVSYDRTSGVAVVTRGQFGTTARAHAAGAVVAPSTNTTPTTLRLPLGTEDGHRYLFTWDALWTDSYRRSGLTNHKAFNFLSGAIGKESVWLEPNAHYGGGMRTAKIDPFDTDRFIAACQTRSYNIEGGPAVWDAAHAECLGLGIEGQPLTQAATFGIAPNVWTRFWYQIEQRANDYDILNAWIADETRDPVHVLRDLPISVRASGITTFVVEFNTSTDLFVRGDLRELVSYVRNVVALQDVPDVPSLLQRPVRAS